MLDVIYIVILLLKANHAAKRYKLFIRQTTYKRIYNYSNYKKNLV